MKIVIAPNSYKGYLSSVEAVDLFYSSLLSGFNEKDLTKYPISDGGDGFLECIKYHYSYEQDHIFMEDIAGKNRYVKYLCNGTEAFIELSEICGLKHLTKSTICPEKLTLEALGILVRKLYAGGYNKINLGLGGSATNDCGIGIIKGMGYKFYDSYGNSLHDAGSLQLLSNIERIEQTVDYDDLRLTLYCDVDNKLIGNDGCTRCYGPQKKIEVSDFAIWDKAFNNYLRVLEEKFSRVFEDKKYFGSAGGASVSLSYFFNAEIKSGNTLFINKSFKELIKNTDCIISGEGVLDKTSLMKKATGEIIKLADLYDKEIFMIVGVSKVHFQKNNINIIQNQKQVENKDEAINQLKESIGRFIKAFDK